MADGQPEPRERDGELHFTFVELLFSLAVAEIAMRFAIIIDVAGENWWNIEYLPSYSHLVVAMVLITTSWIGWGKSKSSHRNTKFTSVFTLDYVELLIDVGLVIVYFVLVHLAEVPDETTKKITATCRPETWCVAVVFALYFVWDVVSKWPRNSTDTYAQIFRRGWVSLVCALLGFGIAKHTQSATNHLEVVLVNFSLIALVVLFRELKEIITNKPTTAQWVRASVVALVTIIPPLIVWL